MKIHYLYLVILLFCTSCSDFLDREPESSPMSGTFYGSETEMNLGLTGLYSTIKWEDPSLSNKVTLQATTIGFDDFGLERKPELAEGNYKTNHSMVQAFWKYAYKTVQCANAYIHGIERGKESVSPVKYNTMQSEARIIRTWAYFWLINLFGDVPLITSELKSEEFYNQKMTSKDEIVRYLYEELDAAAAHLDWLPSQKGRVSRSVAYGLKARIAFYYKDYQTAANAAKTIIENAGLGLAPVFLELYQYTGQARNTNNEIMFELMYSTEQFNSWNWYGMITASRNANSYSGTFPNQNLIDQFECVDGKRIDESPLYDPQNPGKYRDQRLKYSISMPRDTISSFSKPDFIYDIHNSITKFKNSTTGEWTAGTNLDYSNIYGPRLNGVGYLFGKYSYGNKSEQIDQSRHSYIFMRYAEILLTYAEAKIELNQLDDDVVAAIDLVRTRAGQPTVVQSGVDISSQYEMRRLVRRERNVELAGEGFRWFDIRRWGIAEIVMRGSVYGYASTSENINKMQIPGFSGNGEINDMNNIPTYRDTEYRLKRDNRIFEVPKHYLFPIPQSELDLSKTLDQNEGW